MADVNETSRAVVNALVALGERDLPFADRYRQRAEEKLAALLPYERYAALKRDEEALVRLAATLRHATDRGDWIAVRSTAHQAASIRARLASSGELAHLGTAVYEHRLGRASTGALGLHGVLPLSASVLEHERAIVLHHVQLLIAHDPEWRDFYRRRAAHFEGLKFAAGEAHASGGDPALLRRRILEAVERGAFTEIERLAATADGASDLPSPAERPTHRATGMAMAALDAPFPAGTVERATGLGLRLETLSSDPRFEQWLLCSSGVAGGTPAALGAGGPGGATGSCDRPCPDALRPRLCENLLLLQRHPFVSSAGSRYLPSFGTEQLLVETFPETEPDCRTPLLAALGLPARRGLPRIAIEDAILRHSTRVLTTLALDPFEFTLACVPFDAYARLAERHGWGQQQLWTHFDGYQLFGEVDLRALVGGDTRYGGPDDLCSIGRAYGGEHLTVRFAVVRRRRLVSKDADTGA